MPDVIVATWERASGSSARKAAAARSRGIVSEFALAVCCGCPLVAAVPFPLAVWPFGGDCSVRAAVAALSPSMLSSKAMMAEAVSSPPNAFFSAACSRPGSAIGAGFGTIICGMFTGAGRPGTTCAWPCCTVAAGNGLPSCSVLPARGTVGATTGLSSGRGISLSEGIFSTSARILMEIARLCCPSCFSSATRVAGGSVSRKTASRLVKSRNVSCGKGGNFRIFASVSSRRIRASFGRGSVPCRCRFKVSRIFKTASDWVPEIRPGMATIGARSREGAASMADAPCAAAIGALTERMGISIAISVLFAWRLCSHICPGRQPKSRMSPGTVEG